MKMQLIMQDNGFCQGIKVKNVPTWEETIYCLTEILGFNLDYLEYEYDDYLEYEYDDCIDELNERKKEIQDTFIAFIQGDCDWYGLCNNIYCEEDNDDFTIGIFAKLIEYIEEKQIV